MYTAGEESSIGELRSLAVPGGDLALLLRALRTSWTTLVATHGEAVRGIMDALPPELWDGDPWLVGGYGATWRSLGSPSRSAALPYFAAAFAAMTEATSLPVRVGIELHYSAALRSLGRLTEALAAADRAAALVVPDTTMPLAWRIRFGAKAALQRGIVLYHLGEYDSAKTELRTAVGLAQGHLLPAERVECYAALAILEFTLAEFDAASGYAALAREASGGSELLGSPFGVAALITELLVNLERNGVEEAEALADRVGEAATRSDWDPLAFAARAALAATAERYVEGLDLVRQCLQGYRTWAPPGAIASGSEGQRAMLLLRLGRADTAWDILGDLAPTQHHASCPGRHLAHLRFVTGDAAGTLAALSDCLALGDYHSSRTLLDVQLLAAAAHHRLGNAGAADVSFDRALMLAAHNGLRIPVGLVPRNNLLGLLERAGQRSQPERVRQLLSGDDWGPAHTHDQGAPLSERERDIVRALLRGYTVSEMAEELFISVNTVKSHLKSIYRKLGVGTRSAAIRRARELGHQV